MAATGTGAGGRVARSWERSRPLVGVVGLCAAASIGCSAPAPDQTYTQVYGLKDGGTDLKKMAEWACLDNQEQALTPTKLQYQLTGVIVDYESHKPVMADVRACNALDFTCEPGVGQGVTTPPPPNFPTLPGIAVPLPAGDQFFLRITAPSYVPYDYYIGGPITGDVVVTTPFPLVTQSAFANFASGVNVDPVAAAGLGSLGVQIYNCLEEPAAGVSLTFSEPADDLKNAIGWAQQGPYPVLTKTTDSSGTAGFVYLPLRNISFEAVLNDQIHFGKRAFQIKPGRLTAGVIRASGYANGY